MMATLELRFRRDPAPVLTETTFRQRSGETINGGERHGRPLPWRSGIQAFVILLLSWASRDRRKVASEGGAERPAIEASPGSAAASVKGDLGRRIDWHEALFGRDGGRVFRGLIRVEVRE